MFENVSMGSDMIDVQLHNMQKIITHPNGAEKVCVCVGGGLYVWH